MLLARVIGNVVATCKEPLLDGSKFLLLEQATPSGLGKKSYVVAVDTVGAGKGDLVMYTSGSSARLTELTKEKPVDATVMAIVDLIEEQEIISYRKSDEI